MVGEQLQLGEDGRSPALQLAWSRALSALAGTVNKVTFESYIRPIRPLHLQGSEVTLGVSTPFAREWLDKRYRSLIAAALASELGCDVEVRFHVLAAAEQTLFDDKTAEPAPAGESLPTQAIAAVRSSAPAARVPLPESMGCLPLNEKYTFSNFIVGKSNRLAQASAAAVADSPGSVYNPLFVYGGPGLGKTHLLHAVGHSIRQKRPGARIAFVDGENFTYHFVSALRERKTEEFRRHYRGVDIWLVDDIQFIAGKEQTKEEFFHTFNALYQTGKQIVICSDRSPRELRAIDERLRSRFEAGLVADIATPELETRMAILEHRCRAEGWSLEPEIIYYIANAIQSSIRSLEGALTKLVAYSSIMRCPISVGLAESVLGEYLIEKPIASQMRKGISFDMVLGAAAAQFGTAVDAIRGPRRDAGLVMARQVAMFLCRELTGASLAQIGDAIGGRDHTTVQRGIAKIERLLQTDPALQSALNETRSRLER